MISAYDENFIPYDLDPVDGTSQDFPWAEVFERCDSDEGRVADSSAGTETIAGMLNLLLTDAQGARISPKDVGLRVLALGWVMDPANYPGSPSLRELAKRCGVAASALALHSGEVSRATGIRNRAQRHAANWKPAERAKLINGTDLLVNQASNGAGATGSS